MFDISKKMDDKLILDGKEYQLLLSFDRVLWCFEMWEKSYIPIDMKPRLALVKLTGDEYFRDIDPLKAFEVYGEVFENFIKITRPVEDVEQYDLLGNVLPKKSRDNKEDEEPPLYSIKYDGEYIFSSFLQAYQIDLIEAHGKLHWKKFNALLAGLPDGTKLVEVMKIRAWKPSKGDSSKEKQRMRALQEEYALPDH